MNHDLNEPEADDDLTFHFHDCDSRPSADALPPVRGLRILVADDEPMIREVIGAFLDEDFHRVEMAANGAEAIEKFEQGRFDLIITDRAMPGVSGDRLAEVAFSRDPNIRVLMLTGFTEMPTPGSNPHPHVDELIPKPFTFDSLRQGIARTMAGIRV